MLSVRKVLVAIALAVAVAASVAACSSSGSNGTSSSSSSGGSTSGAGAPITVGVMCSCSGALGADNALGWSVIDAWGKSVNADGGIGGHPVQLIKKDDASVPGTSLTDAKALIAQKVDVIIDGDILDSVWQKAVDAAGIPVIGGNLATDAFESDPNWFPSGQTNDSITYSVAATAKQAGAANLAVFYCAEAPVCQQSVPLIKSAGQAVGVPVVYTQSISATAPNYTAQCVAAKQAGVKALFIGDAFSIVARVAADCTAQGYNPIYVTEGSGYTSQALTAPGLKDHLWSSFPILPYYSTEPAVTAMNAALDKYAPGLRQQTSTWSEFAAQAWTGGLLLAQALKNAGVTASTPVSPSVITQGLDKVSDETLGGFSPTLSFTAGKPHPVDCWYVGRVQGGVASQVGGLTCEKN